MHTMCVVAFSLLQLFGFKFLECVISEQTALGLTGRLRRLLRLLYFFGNRLRLRWLDFVDNSIIGSLRSLFAA